MVCSVVLAWGRVERFAIWGNNSVNPKLDPLPAYREREERVMSGREFRLRISNEMGHGV